MTADYVLMMPCNGCKAVLEVIKMKELDYWKIGEMCKQSQCKTIAGHKFYPYATTICAMRNLGISLGDIAEFVCDEMEIREGERITSRQLANYIWKWKVRGMLDELAIKTEEAKIKLAIDGVVVRADDVQAWDNL